MYYVLLAAGNTDFVDSTKRRGHFRSGRLKAVLAALTAVQGQPTRQGLHDLLGALHTWRHRDPDEYAARGVTNGVGYRLFMEAKQALCNNFGGVPVHFDPPEPANCPGTTLLGVYVPPGPHNEICHNFAYRWAIAAGTMQADPARDPNSDAGVNAGSMTPVLYPGANGLAGLPAARRNGVVLLEPGDIVAMYTVAGNQTFLGHSLIAKTSTTWFSANNVGTFGNVGTGRSEVDTLDDFGVVPVQSKNQRDPITGEIVGDKHYDVVGWTGDDNLWIRHADGEAVRVVYRR